MVRGKRREDPKPEGENPPKDHNQKPGMLITNDEEAASYYFDSTRGILVIRSEIEVLQEEIAGLKENEKQWFKEIKARIGMTRADIEFGLSLRTDEDQTRLDEAKRRKKLAAWEEHPLAQMEFDLEDRTPSTDRAHTAGRRAGQKDKPCDVPPIYGQQQAQSWTAGWHEGHASLIEARLKAMRPLEDEKPLADPAQEKVWDDKQVAEQAENAQPEPIGTAPATSEAV